VPPSSGPVFIHTRAASEHSRGRCPASDISPYRSVRVLLNTAARYQAPPGLNENEYTVCMYEEDVSNRVSVFAEGAVTLEFRGQRGTVVLGGSTSGNAVNVALSIAPLVE
jgi:hypothetical protein